MIKPPCFQENVILTCKIVSFCVHNADNFLPKNANAFYFPKSNFKMELTCKKVYFLPNFHKRHKNSSAHIPLTYTCMHIFCSPCWLFSFTLIFCSPYCLFAFRILQTKRIHYARLLFGMTPGVDLSSQYFGAIDISKWCAKFRLECLLLISVNYTLL